MLRLLTILVILGASINTGALKIKEQHKCPYPLCPFKNSPYRCSCPVGSDCDKLDLIHLEHPYYTYDQCDSLFTFKYK